jgi:hypothetical protein
MKKLRERRWDPLERTQMIETENEKVFLEYCMNLRELTKSYTQGLFYNTDFQLLHIASNKWLSAEDKECEFENENRKYPSN